MKKGLMMLFTLVLAVVLFACQTTTTTTQTTTQTTASTTTTTASTTTTTTTEVQDAVLARVYEGSHTVSAMGSDVEYYYEINFLNGEYFFISEFEMGEEMYDFQESGTYSVSGNTITLTPEGLDAVTGEVLANGVISIPIKASAMAQRTARELTATSIARIYVGTHTVSAMGSEVIYVYQMTFAYGVYFFYSEFEMGGEMYSHMEFGTYEVDGEVLTITPFMGEAVTGSISGDEITIGVKASAMATRTDRTLSETALGMHYEGSHDVSAMGSAVTYNYVITFKNGTYNFISEFEMGGEPYTYEETGSYTVSNEGVITLTPEGLDAVTGQINLNYTITLPIKASAMASRGEQVLEFFFPFEEEVVEEVIE